MNSIFAVGSILFGVLSLVICHFRAVVDAQHRRHWSTAFVVAASLLFCNGCVTVALGPSMQGVDYIKEPDECLREVYATTLEKVTMQWLAKQSKLPQQQPQRL